MLLYIVELNKKRLDWEDVLTELILLAAGEVAGILGFTSRLELETQFLLLPYLMRFYVSFIFCKLFKIIKALNNCLIGNNIACKCMAQASAHCTMLNLTTLLYKLLILYTS